VPGLLVPQAAITAAITLQCYKADNTLLAMSRCAHHRWGQPTGPQYIVNTSTIVKYDPWIVDFTEDTPCQGFCPSDIITGNAVVSS